MLGVYNLCYRQQPINYKKKLTLFETILLKNNLTYTVLAS